MECPTDEQLAAHLDGALAAEAGAIGDHVDVCASCRSAVVALVRARGSGPPPPAVAPLPSSTLGRYRLLETIGAGAMGVVYRAHDPALERDVALKVLRVDRGGDAAAMTERMLRESRLLARVVDRAVVTVHDVGVDDDRVFLAMELVEGGTLRTWLAARPRTTEAILAVLARAGAGLAAAHRAGVIHRDFKPDNVLVTPREADRPERVAVGDFGVARIATDASGPVSPGAAVTLTATGLAVGTPAYMAPEQLAGDTVDARADVFAFAVTAWEALYGERPFSGQTVAALHEALARETPTPAARGPGGPVPPRVRQALTAALVRDPTKRPPTLEPILAALAPPSRTRAKAWVLGAGAVALLTGGVALTRPTADTRPTPCAALRRAVDQSWSSTTAPRLTPRLLARGAAPEELARGLARLDDRARAARAVLDERCVAGVAPAPVHACLAARQLELDAVARQLARTEPGRAVATLRLMLRTVSDPEICREPATGTVAAAWPAEPARQDAVAALRLRIGAIEAARDASQFAEALTAAKALGPEVAAIGWEPLAAEHLYLIGSIESLGADVVRGNETLRQAAALAERAHHDYVAASVWLLLVQGVAFTERDAERALEYARYADAASARLRRPAEIEARLAYARGTALIEHGELDAGEAELRRGLALAEAELPDQVGLLVQGLAYALEGRGSYADAVTTYRRALELGVRDGNLAAPAEVTYRLRLAVNLANIGDTDAALAEATRAVELADRTLPADSVDRAIAHGNLAEVLGANGRYQDATTAVEGALALAKASVGERHELYGSLLTIQATMTSNLKQHGRAAELIRRACEIVAFNSGDDDLRTHACHADGAPVLVDAGDHAGARRWLDAALPPLREALGEDHATVATATQALGSARAGLGDRAGARAAFEDALVRIQRAGVAPGYVASAQWSLAEALPATERARARALTLAAVATWREAPVGWEPGLEAAEAWLRAHP